MTVSIVQVIGAAVVLTVGATGGVIGYASVDQDFRKTVEETVPGSEQVLDLIIGEKTPTPAPKPVTTPPSKLKISSPVVVTKPKEEDKPKIKKEESKIVEETKPKPVPMVVPSPPLEKPKETVEEKKPVVAEKKEEVKAPAPAAVEKPKNEEKKETVGSEPSHDIENSSLELMLGELCQGMQDTVNATGAVTSDWSREVEMEMGAVACS